jgi:uncharacterized membrane protein YgdD (TMEM256/DUF423 family)
MGKILGALNACAGLFGACGVAAAAGAAHLPGADHLNAVALILLAHAAALLALTQRVRDDGPGAKIWLASALAIAIGAALFASDVTLLALRGARLFPMAAPTGGTTMILGWLVAFFAGITEISRATLR